MAQWIAHQTSNLGVAGSSPAVGIGEFGKNFSLQQLKFYHKKFHRKKELVELKKTTKGCLPELV